MVSRLLLAVMLVSLVGAAPAPAQFGRGNPELARWYEEAYAYYTAVLSGAEPKPDANEWSEFLNQMDWASKQLGLESGWDAYGGSPGPAGNTVYRADRVRIGFVGEGGTSDIWSNDFTLDVASTSATITVERTTDTRTDPREEVLKIVVTDPATGTEAVYVVHDNEDEKHKIQAPGRAQITGADYKDEVVTVNAPSSVQITDPTETLRIGRFQVRKPGPLPPRHRE
jgi:hypothetical protein